MNKMLLFPLALMFTLTCLVVVMGTTPDPQTVSVNTTGHSDDPTIWNLWGIYDSSVDGDNSSNSVSWVASAFLAALIVAMIVGAAVGFNIVGSGLSEFSQHVVMIALFYLPIWGLLTIATSSYFFADFLGGFGELLYIGLTLSFSIGVISELRGA